MIFRALVVYDVIAWPSENIVSVRVVDNEKISVLDVTGHITVVELAHSDPIQLVSECEALTARHILSRWTHEGYAGFYGRIVWPNGSK